MLAQSTPSQVANRVGSTNSLGDFSRLSKAPALLVLAMLAVVMLWWVVTQLQEVRGVWSISECAGRGFGANPLFSLLRDVTCCAMRLLRPCDV